MAYLWEYLVNYIYPTRHYRIQEMSIDQQVNISNVQNDISQLTT